MRLRACNTFTHPQSDFLLRRAVPSTSVSAGVCRRAERELFRWLPRIDWGFVHTTYHLLTCLSCINCWSLPGFPDLGFKCIVTSWRHAPLLSTGIRNFLECLCSLLSDHLKLSSMCLVLSMRIMSHSICVIIWISHAILQRSIWGSVHHEVRQG